MRTVFADRSPGWSIRQLGVDPRGTDFIACDILIPGKLVRFLEQYANVAFAGIRDRDLVPFGHRVCGWRVGADQRTMTILVPDEFLPRLLESLQQNGELAVTVEEFPSHETYQFKGQYRRHRGIRGRRRRDRAIASAGAS